MEFHVLIPARLASTRLPRKALAEIGGRPMVVRVAEQALASGATSVTVATDAVEIVTACAQYQVAALLTRADHASGSDRLAEAAARLALTDDAVVVNVQGDEPLIEPELIRAVAHCLHAHADAQIATAAHPISNRAQFDNPNVVKVVLDARSNALLFSRSAIPHWRDGAPDALPTTPAPLRHIGIYAYRARYLRAFPNLPNAPLEQCESLEQLRALWHGDQIAVHVTTSAPEAGVDTADDLERVRVRWARLHAATRPAAS